MSATGYRWISENNTSQSSPSTVWDTVVKLRSAGLVANAWPSSTEQSYKLFSKTFNEWFSTRKKMRFILKIKT